MNHNLH